jgi:hypothetical protein
MEKKSKTLNIQGSVIPHSWTSTALGATQQGSSSAPDKKCISSLALALEQREFAWTWWSSKGDVVGLVNLPQLPW